MPEAIHLHQSYWTEPRRLQKNDSEALHRLAVAVSWPHRPEDLAALLSMGDGYIANDDADRTIASGMVFSYGDEMSMIGMMMTHPKLQGGGMGEVILDLLMKDTGTDRLRLNATKSAHRLYRKAGFTETGTVVQYQGQVNAAPVQSTASLRAAEEQDLPDILALDRATFGADRTAIIKSLFENSQTVVLEKNGRVTGFAMCRMFGRGHVIGPLVAGNEDDAVALVSDHLSRHIGRFVRLDADERHGALGNFLNDCGLETYDRVIPMSRGGAVGPEGAVDWVYSLAGQAIG